MENKEKPEKTFRAGVVSVSIWNNKIQVNGADKEIKNISFQRNFKAKDGEWKTTSSLNTSDIPKAIVALEKAYEYVTLR